MLSPNKTVLQQLQLPCGDVMALGTTYAMHVDCTSRWMEQTDLSSNPKTQEWYVVVALNVFFLTSIRALKSFFFKWIVFYIFLHRRIFKLWNVWIQKVFLGKNKQWINLSWVWNLLKFYLIVIFMKDIASSTKSLLHIFIFFVCVKRGSMLCGKFYMYFFKTTARREGIACANCTTRQTSLWRRTQVSKKIIIY